MMKNKRLTRQSVIRYSIAFIMFVFAIVGAKAQTLDDPHVSWNQSVEFTPIKVNNVWHIVKGTQVTVTLKATIPENTDEKKYEQNVIYRKGTEDLHGNTDTFVPSNGTVRYTAVFKYQKYKKNAETQEWEKDGDVQEESTESKEVTFNVYDNPNIESLTVISSKKYTLRNEEDVLITVQYAPAREGLNYRISWEKDGSPVNHMPGQENTYALSTNAVGIFNVKATVKVYAPDGTTLWDEQSENVTVTVYEVPSITSIIAERKYALAGDAPFNINIGVSKNEKITTAVAWNGGATGNNLTGTFNPQKAGTYTLSAKVTFKDPEGQELKSVQSQDVTIMVYEVPSITSIIADRKYALAGDAPFNINIGVSKNEKITTAVAWNGGATGNNLTGTFNPQKAGTYTLSAKVTFKDPEGQELKSVQSQDVTITVYEVPSITSIIADRKYALAGDAPFNINIGVSKNEKITTAVAWNGGATGNNLTGTFNPQKAGTYTLSAKVTFKDPEGQELKSVQSQDVAITVYEVPSITSIIADRKYALAGDAPFKINIGVSKNEKITTAVVWDGGATGDNLTGTFNPQKAGTYILSAKVTFKDPEGNALITLPTEEKLEQEITVFERPVITRVRFVPEDVNETYVGNKLNITLDVNKDDNISAEVDWKNATKDVGGGWNEAIYTAPNEACEQTITATVTFTAPDKSKLLELNGNKKIKVLALMLEVNKKYTYAGDPTFRIEIKGYNPVSGYEPHVIWSENVESVGDGLNALTAKFSDKVEAGGNVVITAKVETKKIGGTEVITSNEVSKGIMIYEHPKVTNNKLTASSLFACIDGIEASAITVDITHTPANLPRKIYWYNDDKKINNEGNNYTFTPKAEGETSIKVEVQILDPEGKEVWLSEYTDPITITALPNPTKVITNDILKARIEEPNDNPEMIIGHANKEFEFTYSVQEPDNRYKWKYKWQLNGKSGTWSEKKDTTFNNLEEGEYRVTLIAQALNPNGSGKEWGTPITYQINNPIIIYPEPKLSLLDYHEIKSESHEYSTYKNVEFDAAHLYSAKGGYPDNNMFGWKTELYVSKDGKPEEKNEGLTFSPKEVGEYTLRLAVKNQSPNDNWYNSEDSTASDFTYKLHVYDEPAWETNIAKLFDITNVGGMYDDINDLILHVKSGDKVPFEISTQNGFEDKWNVNITCNGINEGNPTPFTKTESGFRYNFAQTNDSENEATYNFNIHISNDIDYLVRGVQRNAKEISGKIIVWKDITANVKTPEFVDGKYLLETREGDDDRQVIEFNLIGGDSQKWSVVPNNNESPLGVKEIDNHTCTYTINGINFKADNGEAKTYEYSFAIRYKDGQTDIQVGEQKIYVKVWPKPTLAQTLTLPSKNVTYKPTNSGNYNVICYTNDVMEMTVSPSGGNTERGIWKYQTPGMSTKEVLPADNKITISRSGTAHFYNYLSDEGGGTKEKEVLSITTQVLRKSDPNILVTLPSVDNTTEDLWNKAHDERYRVDLYGKGHTASFDFTPRPASGGYEGGWHYSWKIDGVEQSNAYGIWNYDAKVSSDAPYEDKTITVDIKNSIPASEGQVGENIGYEETKIFHIRVWHEAVMPTEDYKLVDEYNSSNDVKISHGIREGNNLKAYVDKIQYGYNPNNNGSHYEYSWQGQGAQDKNEWTRKMENSDSRTKPGYSEDTYKLTVRNKGPRGTIWAEKTFDDCNVKIYNRPNTPVQLIKKGNGSSGTMIIDYESITDKDLLAKGDYVIDFCYTDENGEHKIITKQQTGETEQDHARWATGYSGTQMDKAYVYAHWLDEANGVLITSGKRTLGNVDEDWDSSLYNLTPGQISDIRAMTRAGNGDYTSIHTINQEEITDDNICVYNLNGMKVGTSIEGLRAGIYFIRYQQGGEIKSKKLYIK